MMHYYYKITLISYNVYKKLLAN